MITPHIPKSLKPYTYTYSFAINLFQIHRKNNALSSLNSESCRNQVGRVTGFTISK